MLDDERELGPDEKLSLGIDSEKQAIEISFSKMTEEKIDQYKQQYEEDGYVIYSEELENAAASLYSGKVIFVAQ